MLINDKPTYIKKKRYFVQKYLRKILFGTNKNTNEVMYSIVYDRSLEFFCAKTDRKHKVTIRCVFDVFRIQTVNQPITFMNISCYIRDWRDRIKDKINLFLWASENDDKILDRVSLTSEQKCELQKAEKEKFDFMLHYFKNFSIFDPLNAIYPNLKTDVELQNTLKKMLNITSFSYDEVIKPYADIILKWPSLQFKDTDNI